MMNRYTRPILLAILMCVAGVATNAAQAVWQSPYKVGMTHPRLAGRMVNRGHDAIHCYDLRKGE